MAAAPAEPVLLADFVTWLRKHRGASDATIRLHARDAVAIMTALGSAPLGWEPHDIRGYFLDRASKSGRGTIEKTTTSLRACFCATLQLQAAAGQVSMALFRPMPIGSLQACPAICRPNRSAG